MVVPTSRHGQPAYAVVRSLILGVSTLAIVGVLFVVYQMSTGVSQPPIAEAPTPPPPPPSKPKHPAPAPEEMPSVSLGDGRALGPGERITLTQYEPGSKRARFELEVSDWQPTGASSDEFHVVKPEIRLRTPDGQFVRVTADEGWIQLAKGTTDSPEPTGGRFSGNVAITIDRLTELERSKLPPDERDRPDEARLIHIAFEELSFDLNEARIEAPGPFSLKMAEAELESSGLVFHYNERESRIERLEISGAVTGFLRGADTLFGANKTGEETTMADVAEASGPSESAEPSVESSDDIPLFVLDDPHQPNIRPTHTYLADVEGPVSIRQTVGDALVLSLAADKLHLLFDFAQQHRDAAQTNDPSPGSSEANESESVEDADAENDRPEARVFFEWAGPFVMRSVDPASTDDGEPIGQRVRIVASGDKVHFLDRRLDVICKKIEVHRQAEKVWITGTPDEPVVLSTEQYDDMVAVGVFIDQAAGYVRITGPARLGESSGESSGDASTDIRFDELAELTLGKHIIERIIPDTGDIVKTESEYMSAASFSGAVRMAQGSNLISGDTVKMSFDPPTTPGAFAENIRTIDAKGSVTMTRGDDRISADELSILLAPAPDGRALPRLLDALGHVIVRQGTRTITAGERISAVMIPVIEPKPAFDMVAARFKALRAGVDPNTVDWQRVRGEYEQQVSYTVGLETFDARGGVTAYDSTGGLDLVADSLTCDFTDGGTVDRIRIIGPTGQPAHVAFGERSVTAHRIDVDLGDERIDVDGAGEITMVTYRGLDGSISDSPQHVNIAWTEAMSFRGAANTARFAGQVRAVSRRSHGSPPTLLTHLLKRDEPVTIETSTFEADSLVIDFVDRDPKPTQQSTLRDQWWVFAPLVERITKPSQSPLPRFSKEPVTVVARDNVSIKFTNTDPLSGRVDSRIYLAASRMTVDLRAKLLTTPVSGTLLIENYKISESDQRVVNPRSAPFASAAGNLPSQTYIEWADSMSLDARQTRAEFLGDVLLDYRSGMKIALLDELAMAYTFVPPSGSTVGRQTVLTCESLVAEFGGAEAQSSSGGDGIKVKDIRRFEASGGVYLEDDQFTVSADRIVKHASSDLLAIYGRAGASAEIHSRDGKGPTLHGPQFLYHLDTGRIDAPDIIVHTRR